LSELEAPLFRGVASEKPRILEALFSVRFLGWVSFKCFLFLELCKVDKKQGRSGIDGVRADSPLISGGTFEITKRLADQHLKYIKYYLHYRA
jgi:hypothetical protein